MTKAKPTRSTGDLYEEDVERMIVDWRGFARDQRHVAALTHSALARSNAERYERLADQAQALLDTQQTIYSPPAKPVAVPGAAVEAGPLLPQRTRKKAVSKAPSPPSVAAEESVDGE